MARQVIHSGEFVGFHGIVWRVDIWERVDEIDYGEEPGELTFPAEEPVVIEWEERSKEEVICGSSCTLRIESPGDRTYAGLYSEKPGAVGVDVYKDDTLYWRGTLDTEQYEEPYERLDKYDVELTFSDFGAMERMDFDMDGCIPTLAAVLSDALFRAGLGDLAVDQSLISSSIGGVSLRLSDLCINAQNFYDEDGEPSTLYEVVEGILQPLALRIIQKAGKIWVYDLNGLHGAAAVENTWSGDSQTLGVDRVYNDIKVTFSPYGAVSLMKEDDVEFTDEADEEAVNYDHIGNDAVYWTFFEDESDKWSFAPMYSGQAWPCFTIHKGMGKGFEDTFLGARTAVGREAPLFRDRVANGDPLADATSAYFRIVAQGGGEDCDGYAWMFKKGGESNHALYQQLGHDWDYVGMTMFATRRVYLPPLPSSTLPSGYGTGFGGSGGGGNTPNAMSHRWMLRLRLDMLADVRYNPFGEDGGDNDISKAKDELERHGPYFIHKAHVLLWSAKEGGTVLYHYDNTAIESDGDISGTSRPYDKAYVANSCGEWVAGNSQTATTRLSWYDNTNDGRNRKTGVCGWKGNRHTIGRWDDVDLSQQLLDAPEGQYIPYPPSGGWIQVAVISCPNIHDGENAANTNAVGSGQVGALLRWMLYKHPVLELVQGFKYDKAEVEDVEFSAFADADAREDLELSTICGTLSKAVPSARGAYRLASNGALAYDLTRAGHTDRIERLWLGTLYSQFAARHTMLSGESDGDHDGLHPYTEANQGETLFICTGETLDCITDTSERTLIELSPDEYTAEIYKE